MASLRWRGIAQEKAPARTQPVLKIVLALGVLVFVASCSAAAHELVQAEAIGPVTLFWMGWSSAAAALALLLLKTSQ